MSELKVDKVSPQSGTALEIGDSGDIITLPAGSVTEKGADIASATTLVIGTDGDYFDITGTTAITGMTVTAGRRFTLQFDGIVTITDNAAITLSGAANFTTAAGDILSFIAVAANTVVQTGYSLVDGGSPVTASITTSAGIGLNGNQTIATGTWTKVEFADDSTVSTVHKRYDIGGDYNTGTYRFTAPAAGRYFIHAQGMYSSTLVDGKQYRLGIYINGTRIHFSDQQGTHDATNYMYPSVTSCTNLAASDYIEIWTYQVSGSNSTFSLDYEQSWFHVHRLS